MTRRVYLYGSILLLAAGLLLWRAASRSSGELQHDGRPLSAWLEEVGEGPEDQRARAVAALLAMEPAIWDQLVNMLAAKDSVWRRALERSGVAPALGRLGGSPAREQHGAAIIAFLALGSSARPAVPALIALLDRPADRDRAIAALAAIGPDAVPDLTGALTNAHPEVRCAAAELLGYWPLNAAPALPALRMLTRDPSTNVSASALRSIKAIETLKR